MNYKIFAILLCSLFLFSCKKDKVSWTLTISNLKSKTLYIHESTYGGEYFHTITVGANDTVSQKSMIVNVPYKFLAIDVDGDTIESFSAKGKYNKEILWTIE